MKRLLLICTVALVSTIATLAACKQGEGERCQINDDCASNLVCNRAKNTCESSTGGDLDANVPLDAATDAPPDAPPDAPLDAMPDAP